MRFRSQVTITTPPIDENEGLVIRYGDFNFKSIRFSNGYYCDKTSYIQKLEKEGSRSFLFLRPRRFGKSLFLDTLNCFHNELYKNDYVKLFEGLDIFKMPDAKPNTYMVLNLSSIFFGSPWVWVGVGLAQRPGLGLDPGLGNQTRSDPGP